MAGPALNPSAQQSAGQPPQESVDTLLEMQRELDIANDIRPAERDTGRPGGNTTGTPRLEVLDTPTCLDLIRGGGVGRIVFDDDRGPLALPMNFRTIDGEIVFQTGHGAIAAAMTSGRPLSVEIDHFDDALGEGWSVLLRGHGRLLAGAAAQGELHEVSIESWAGAERSTAVGLVAEEVTGRRVRRHPSTPGQL